MPKSHCYVWARSFDRRVVFIWREWYEAFCGLATIKWGRDERTHSVFTVDLACSVGGWVIWRRVRCLGLLPFSWPGSVVFNVSLGLKQKIYVPRVMPNTRFDGSQSADKVSILTYEWNVSIMHNTCKRLENGTFRHGPFPQAPFRTVPYRHFPLLHHQAHRLIPQ